MMRKSTMLTIGALASTALIGLPTASVSAAPAAQAGRTAGFTFTNPRDCVLQARFTWDPYPGAVAAGVAIFQGGVNILKTKEIHGPGGGSLTVTYRGTESTTPTTWYANGSLYGQGGGSIYFEPTLEMTVNCS